MLSTPWNNPTLRSWSSLTVQSTTPVAAVATAAAMPAAVNTPAGSRPPSGAGSPLVRSRSIDPAQNPMGRSDRAGCSG